MALFWFWSQGIEREARRSMCGALSSDMNRFRQPRRLPYNFTLCTDIADSSEYLYDHII